MKNTTKTFERRWHGFFLSFRGDFVSIGKEKFHSLTEKRNYFRSFWKSLIFLSPPIRG